MNNILILVANFNLDKGEPQLFGFFSDIDQNYGIVLQNNQPVGGFSATLDEDYAVIDEFESYKEEHTDVTMAEFLANNDYKHYYLTPNTTNEWTPSGEYTVLEDDDAGSNWNK